LTTRAKNPVQMNIPSRGGEILSTDYPISGWLLTL
jgi:hypothetical protein